MTKMHLLWFCAFSPHAGFGLDGWAGPQTGMGYDWTTPELWQDMAVVLEVDRKFKSPFAPVGVGSPAPSAGRHGALDAVRRLIGVRWAGIAQTRKCATTSTARTLLTSPRASSWA